LDNGAVNPENKCFCREGVCLKPGLIDVTDCYYGKISSVCQLILVNYSIQVEHDET